MINSEKLKTAINKKDYSVAYRILTEEIERIFDEKMPRYKKTQDMQDIPEEMLALVLGYNDITNSETNISLTVYRLMHLYKKISTQEVVID